MPPSKKLPKLLPTREVVKLIEPQPMLLPWLLNTSKLMTRMPPLEPSITTRKLPTTLSTTNGRLEPTDPPTTPVDGLKFQLQEIEPLTQKE